MSGSLRPHGLQLARLLTPWNSPGTNTGAVRCALLQGLCPAQRSKLGLLHCKQILYCLSHQVRGNSVDMNLSTVQEIVEDTGA